MNTTNERRPPLRLSFVRIHLPETTIVEKLFLFVFVACLLIMAITVNGTSRPEQSALLSFFIYIATSVLTYWMMRDPAFFLQFLLLPFSGRMAKWPAILTVPVRVFGFVGYLFSLALPSLFLPRHWISAIIVVLSAVTVSFFVLRRIYQTLAKGS